MSIDPECTSSMIFVMMLHWQELQRLSMLPGTHTMDLAAHLLSCGNDPTTQSWPLMHCPLQGLSLQDLQHEKCRRVCCFSCEGHLAPKASAWAYAMFACRYAVSYPQARVDERFASFLGRSKRCTLALSLIVALMQRILPHFQLLGVRLGGPDEPLLPTVLPDPFARPSSPVVSSVVVQADRQYRLLISGPAVPTLFPSQPCQQFLRPSASPRRL